MFWNSIWWLAIGVPVPSNIKNREEVVPQSMLPMYQCVFSSSSVSEIPRGRCSWCSKVAGAFTSFADFGSASGRSKSGTFSMCCIFVSGSSSVDFKMSKLRDRIGSRTPPTGIESIRCCLLRRAFRYGKCLKTDLVGLVRLFRLQLTLRSTGEE
jgi:hypothetical protein